MRLSIPIVRRRVAEGVMVGRDRGASIVNVDPPLGYVSAATGLHWTVYAYDPGDGSDPSYQAALARALDDWQKIEPCDTPDCDTCRDLHEERKPL